MQRDRNSPGLAGGCRPGLAVPMALAASLFCPAALGTESPATESAPALASQTPATAPTPSTTSLGEKRAAAQQRFLQRMDEGRPADAVPAALEVAELTRQLYGASSILLASPLTNLATAQLESGDLLAAESNYVAGIGIIERSEGIISPRLTNPLVGLGETYIRGEQYTQATETYERALRVNHVNEGFYNQEQFRIHDGLTEGYLGQQKLDKANFYQEAQVAVQRRKLGPESPALTPALYKLGRWYTRSNQPEAARSAYQEAERILEGTGGENDPALVEPLLAIADSYRQQALLPAAPHSNEAPEAMLPMSSVMLRKALAIIDRQAPPDPARRAAVLVRLGDLYLLWGRRRNATEKYAEAWTELSKDESDAALRDDYFANPHRIAGPEASGIFPKPSRKSPAPPRLRDLEPGYVLVRYAVDPAGRVNAVRVVESAPGGLLDADVAGAVRATLYRPRFVDGAPVQSEELTLRHEFRFAHTAVKQDPPASRGPAPAADDTGVGSPLPQPPG